MRYVILGAGAVGGALGFLLSGAGCDVVLIARGAHGQAIRDRGLTLREPGGSRTRRIDCVAHPNDVSFADDDVVLLAVKSQDAEAALADVDERVAVVCAQNGVSIEPLAAGRFERVFGMMTWTPALHLEPGVVDVYAESPPGVLRLGRYPEGVDQLANDITADLSAAGFDAEPVADIMSWKRSKLINNLGNVLDAFGERDESLFSVFEQAAEEGIACLRAAGLHFIPRKQLFDDMVSRMDHRATVSGEARPGGSTWQSATRGRSTELPFLNGWIRDLGERVGVPTPINRAFLRVAEEATGPRSVPIARIRELIQEEEAT